MRARRTVAAGIFFTLLAAWCGGGAFAQNQAFGWGQDTYGQLGEAVLDRPSLEPVAGLSGVQAVSAGDQTGAAVLADGSVWAWGNNHDGLVDPGHSRPSAVPVPVAGVPPSTAVACGFTHILALAADGTVWAWGYNGNGQLGDGTHTWRATPVPVSALTSVADVAADAYCRAALGSDGALWTWGSGSYGQLGIGTTAEQTVPARVTSLAGVSAVEGGYYHTLATAQCGLSLAASVPRTAVAGQAVAFTAAPALTGCSGSFAYDWDFGDGSPHATVQNPSHAYSAAGTYTWTLTVGSGSLSGTLQGRVTVTVPPPQITSMAKSGNPFKVKVTGSNLQDGVRVFIEGAEWTLLKWKSSSQLLIKGGTSLKTAVPKNTPRRFRFLNPDGGEAVLVWQWP